MYKYIYNELDTLLKSQKRKLLQDFYLNLEIFGELIKNYNDDGASEKFDKILRRMILKLNNTSFLFTALYSESQDENKYSKELQKDIKDTCLAFYKSLSQIKSAFEDEEELERLYQFYMELLQNPLKMEATKIFSRVKVNVSFEEQSLRDDVEEKVRSLLSICDKSDFNLDIYLTKIVKEFKIGISSSVNQIKMDSFEEIKHPTKKRRKNSEITDISINDSISEDYQHIIDAINKYR